SGDDFLRGLERLADADAGEMLALARRAIEASDTTSTPEFAASLSLGRGVTGYAYHTVPVALHAWQRHQNDFRSAVVEVIRCGGDADTTAAVGECLVDGAGGALRIPSHWLRGRWEWPRTAAWMERLAGRVASFS